MKVYRPLDYDFPPSRGRDGLEFRENKEFIRYDIAPTDGSVGVHGKWEFEGAYAVRVYFDNQKNPSYTITIISCDDNLLKIKK